jgi:hypothetical protein
MKAHITFIQARPSPALGGANVECGEYVTGMRLCLCSRSKNGVATPSTSYPNELSRKAYCGMSSPSAFRSCKNLPSPSLSCRTVERDP